MAHKHDSYLTALHKLRQIKGASRQASFKPSLRRLQQVLSAQIKEPHPYRLIVNKTLNQMAPLLRVPEFTSGATGSRAAPSTEYIYHLTSVRKVIGSPPATSALIWNYFPPAFPNLYEPDWKLFECLQQEYKHTYGGTGWMPLNSFAAGKYSVRRDFTWWTDQKFPEAHIVCAAHRVGLPNTWIPKYALVMRCPARKMAAGLSHVPTVLDGFTSEIFSPTDYRTTVPTHGEAIDLDSRPRLSTGAKEFALNPIDVGSIEFRPVLIDNKKRRRHVVNRDALLWQLLEIYYYHL